MKCIVLLAFIMIIMVHMLKVGSILFLLLAVCTARHREEVQYCTTDIIRNRSLDY